MLCMESGQSPVVSWLTTLVLCHDTTGDCPEGLFLRPGNMYMGSLIPRPSPSFLLLAVRKNGRGPGTYYHMSYVEDFNCVWAHWVTKQQEQVNLPHVPSTIWVCSWLNNRRNIAFSFCYLSIMSYSCDKMCPLSLFHSTSDGKLGEGLGTRLIPGHSQIFTSTYRMACRL